MSTMRTIDSRRVGNVATRLTALVAFALSLHPSSASAAARLLVGDGTPASCTQVMLQSALDQSFFDGGDVIRFNCGDEPVTIELNDFVSDPNGNPVALIVPNKTTIDGEGMVALSVNGFAVGVFVNTGTTVTLARLAMDTLFTFPLVLNSGSLTVGKVAFSQGGGGAITNSGQLTVSNSTFSEFTISPAISSSGVANIDRSTFTGNRIGFIAGGGAISSTGTLNVTNTVFSNNEGDLQGGGAIIAFGPTTIDNCKFSNNVAFFAGAIEAGDQLTVTSSTFSNNSADGSGGGAITASSAVIRNCKFFNNTGGAEGGAILAGNLTMDRTTISGNSATFGGGIFATGAVTISNSSITNDSASEGGGIFLASTATLTLAHTHISGNTPDDIFPPIP
jgi:predicted outer membrane repeat protein